MHRVVATVTTAFAVLALFAGPAWAEDEDAPRKIRILNKKRVTVVAPKQGGTRKVVVRSGGHDDPGAIVHEWLRDQLGGKVDEKSLGAWFKDDRPALRGLRDLFKKRGWDAKRLAQWLHAHASAPHAHSFTIRAPSGAQMWGSGPQRWSTGRSGFGGATPPMPPQMHGGWGMPPRAPRMPNFGQGFGPWMSGPQVSPWWGAFAGPSQRHSPWGFPNQGPVRWGMSQPQVHHQHQIWMHDGTSWRQLPGTALRGPWGGGQMPPMPPMWGGQMPQQGPWGFGQARGRALGPQPGMGFGPGMGGKPMPSAQTLEQLKQQLQELRQRLEGAKAAPREAAPHDMRHQLEDLRRRLEGLAPKSGVEHKSEFVIRGPDGSVIQGSPRELSKFLKGLGAAGEDLKRKLKGLGIEVGEDAPAPAPEKSDK